MKDGKWMSLLGIVAVAALGWVVYSSNQSRMDKNGIVPGIGGGPGNETTITSANVRSSLQMLLPEHEVLANNHLQTLYDGKDTSETAKSLEDNNQQIALLIEQIGGNKEEFLSLWRAHITGYENYTKTLKNNDEAEKSQAKTELTANAIQMGNMINQLIPSVSSQEGRKLMQEHINLTLSIIDAHSKGNTTEKLEQMTKASKQAFDFANTLADGIEKSGK